MAAIMGKDGSFRVGANVVGSIDAFTLDMNIGSAEVTQMSTETNTFRNYIQTIKDWSGTASGTLDLADAQQLALEGVATTAALASSTMRFYTGGASYWAGTALLTGMTVNSQVADKVSVSFAFQGTSALAYTS